MEKRHVKDVIRALERLGCQAIIPLRVGKSHHVSAYRPSGEHVYIHDLADAEKLILELARERVGAARA